MQAKRQLPLHAPNYTFFGRAIALADEAAPAMAALASYQRQEVLEHCVREFQDRFEDLAMSLCIEAGKPIKVKMPLPLSSL
jgi:acyl-CoA reductase-like NAD-dependent aldehyde dehydrogenase